MRLDLELDKYLVYEIVYNKLRHCPPHSAAVQILEAALKVGTCSLKLRGSVFSALSSALWGLGQLDKAVYYMQQDLNVAKNLGKLKPLFIFFIKEYKCC